MDVSNYVSNNPTTGSCFSLSKVDTILSALIASNFSKF